MYKIMIRFGFFCDIQNNQCLDKSYPYQPQPGKPYLILDYSGYHKNLIQ